MRITAQEKVATRQRILTAAMKSFRRNGFDATTTRDIAIEAGIATGTLFNYFATKEAIVGCLAGNALAKAHSKLQLDAAAELDEELFALIAAELRQLRPLRKFLAPLLEMSLCQLVPPRPGDSEIDLRTGHLELVVGIVRRHGFPDLSVVTLQVYWTLYFGVLAFWAADGSPKQEDTLALLDQSLRMFVGWLCREN